MKALGFVGCATAIVAACLPFAREFLITPPIVGVYRDATGAPLAGVELAVSPSETDSLCADAAVLRTTTDSIGAFAFPRTIERYPVTVLLPFETFPSQYCFCAAVADTMRFVFRAFPGSGKTYGVTCTESQGPNGPTVSCTQNSR